LNNLLDLHARKIAVTGATGFIGGRLVDYLVLHYEASVRALIRGYGRAVRLARLPVDLVVGDVLDFASVQEGIKGCDFVFHCASDASGDDETRYRIIVEGTRNALEAAKQAEVKRFIHVSTIAVHGPNPGSSVNENSPMIYGTGVYADAKIDAEKLVHRYTKDVGLPVVIVRPTIVYGPRSVAWTLNPINAMKKGKISLLEGGSGTVNHVYIDDVVQALLLAATHPEAVGETFIASCGSVVTWREFYGYYAQMLGVEMPNLSLKMIDQSRKKLRKLRNPINLGLSFITSPHAQSIVKEFSGPNKILNIGNSVIPKRIKTSVINRASEMRDVKLNPPAIPNQAFVDFYLAKQICEIEKAKRVLDYHPHFSLDEGMKLTESWLSYSRII
jgi:nucleoside-diphosphate-sugar epimerase